MAKNLVRILLNTLLGVVLVLLWLKFVNLSQILNTLKGVDIKYVLFFFVFFILSSVFRATRLSILLSKFKIPLKNMLFLNFLSQFLSFTIPIRAGEIAKSVYLSGYDIPLTKSVLWVLIDRFLDFWVNLGLVALLLYIIETSLPSKLKLVFLLVFIGFSLVSLIIFFSRKLALKLIDLFLPGFLKKIASNIIEGFSILERHPLELLGIFILTVLAAFSDALMWGSVLLSIGVNLGFLKTLLGSLLSSLTFLIPAAPGYVGSAEASGLAVFTGVLGVGANLASSATILLHILTLISLPIMGVTALYILKFNLNLVWKRLRGK